MPAILVIITHFSCVKAGNNLLVIICVVLYYSLICLTDYQNNHVRKKVQSNYKNHNIFYQLFTNINWIHSKLHNTDAKCKTF